MIIRAVYQDGGGNRYSCPVVRDSANVWKLSTARGLRDIDYFIAGSDSVGGLLEFSDYDIDPQQKLRAADYLPFINKVRGTLPWPQRPADPPQPQPEPEDTRLHVPDRIGTENSLQVLQRAYAEQIIAAQRKDRQQLRQDLQNTPVDQHTLTQARRFANEYAALRKPKRAVKTGE